MLEWRPWMACTDVYQVGNKTQNGCYHPFMSLEYIEELQRSMEGSSGKQGCVPPWTRTYNEALELLFSKRRRARGRKELLPS